MPKSKKAQKVAPGIRAGVTSEGTRVQWTASTFDVLAYRTRPQSAGSAKRYKRPVAGSRREAE